MSNDFRSIQSYVGGFLTHLVMGSFYLWGNLSIYVASYYRLNGYPQLETSTVQQVFPLIYFGMSFGFASSMYFCRLIGHKWTSAINMLIYCLSNFLASISNFYFFVVLMGFVPGITIGIEYLIPVDNSYKFQTKYRGAVTGFILCGLGFGALIFNPILQYLINPKNEKTENGYYSSNVANNVPSALAILSGIYTVIGFFGVLLMTKPKESSNKIEESIEEESSLLQTIEKRQIEVDSLKEAILTKEFAYLMVIIYFGTGLGLMSAANYKSYGLTYIDDEHFFTLVGSLGGFFNGLSRFFWSFLLDYFSENAILRCNLVLYVFSSLTIELIAQYKFCLMIWIIMIYFQYGGMYTYFPTVTTKTFGKKLGPEIFNLSFLAVALSNGTQFILVKYVKPEIGWSGIYYIYGGMGSLALLLQLIFQLKYQPKGKKIQTVN